MSDATNHLAQAALQKRCFPNSQFYLPFGPSGLYEAVTNLSIALDPAFATPDTMGDVGDYINLGKGYEEDLAALICADFIFTYLLEGWKAKALPGNKININIILELVFKYETAQSKADLPEEFGRNKDRFRKAIEKMLPDTFDFSHLGEF